MNKMGVTVFGGIIGAMVGRVDKPIAQALYLL